VHCCWPIRCRQMRALLTEVNGKVSCNFYFFVDLFPYSRFSKNLIERIQKDNLQIFCLYCPICVQLGAWSLHPIQLSKFCKIHLTGVYNSPLSGYDITLTSVPWNYTSSEGKERLGTVWLLFCHGVYRQQYCYNRQKMCSLRGTSWILI
jgi:hypothetical protein